ncbi:pyridoxamine 5'-phosphate oxidase family protein [Streptomyces ferrugineus]|uniref:Pyridoxamine 5'-phosphate oxidase family protein n=1 Tax=Streptomyces ferrugineus TaxID=1413221 RepID=A0A7M2SEW9_9ACTN|nr:pyridoxamine 5'-phosphate oxidase family protein [Streptomyces ferrugineus]QOV33741.1 pyridoxamine 5'-phosphate oxidase family protein [Streptomyces ferrugineus]
MTEQVRPAATEAAPAGDLGRRIARRRTELGLSLKETATRAGMAPAYLRYLEEHPAAAPAAGALHVLAEVLHTTVRELTGGDTDLPPGAGPQASGRPGIAELSTGECRALLSTHGVGRIAVPTVTGPVVVPVNYSVVAGAIVFRTAPGTTPSQAAGCQVAFEVDRIDDVFGQGWSVLVRGRARTVTDPDEAHRLDEAAYSRPWVGGRRDQWVLIDPLTITGRRITV